jgi:uncharacterized membrane protein
MMPDFTEKGEFRMEANKENVQLSENVKIKIVIHNGGSAPADVNLSYARPMAEYKNAFSVIEGETTFNGTIGAGKSANVEYVIKPHVTGSITLPPAIVYYENAFGETEAMFSEQVTINVSEDTKPEAFFAKEREAFVAGENAKLQLEIVNNANYDLEGVQVILQASKGLAVANDFSTQIGMVPAKSSVSRDLELRASASGKYTIGCIISSGEVEAQCAESALVFEQPAISPAIIIGVAFVLLGAAIYAYIQFSE